jgi:ABC-type cobalamin/Fe3+-siderophores transport system ATPase subunit
MITSIASDKKPDLRLQAEQLHVRRGGKAVLARVSFTVAQGEVYGLQGGNGAGKSTTLSTFLGFLPPARGRVLVNGLDVDADLLAVRRAMAYLPAPLASKLETDLVMLTAPRELNDGHNAKDPAFAKLRAELLAQHGVERVEDLPANLRGVVAQVAEKELTDTLNAYAQKQMAAQTRQAAALALGGWLTPLLAVAEASRAVAATDLVHHHRLVQEAEALR